MADKPINFLLANGEQMTEPVTVRSGYSEKEAPYENAKAKVVLTKMLSKTLKTLDALPELALPNGQAVLSMVLHPEYLAKSYYPASLFSSVGLRAVGSRLVEVKPRQRSRGRKPENAAALELFVAGNLARVHDWLDVLPKWNDRIQGFDQLNRIESIGALDAAERTRLTASEKANHGLYEVVLHANANGQDEFVVGGFQAYLDSLEIDYDFERRFYAGGLCFLRLEADQKHMPAVGEFSFLRVARPMPRLRMLPARQISTAQARPVVLPDDACVDPTVRVAVFDGGIKDDSPLEQWTVPYEFPNAGPAVDECVDHGETVTSSLLFGSIPDDGVAPVPYANVDHYRVLDEVALADPFELYEVLERIKGVLDSNQYPFVNLSLGPALPVEDHDVHAWTAVLDEYLAAGNTLATIAVGNTGEDPTDIINDARRIQVPSDCVNALSIGAADSCNENWARAGYSSIGPGRSPGVIKPDLVAFGGSEDEPFWVTDPNTGGSATATEGTSYAAPAALRAGLGVRSHFGDFLQPLALKTLLVHAADAALHPRPEIGWGRVSEDLSALVVCPPGVARILYQGELMPKRYLRAKIPLPVTPLNGMVRITATFCFATPVDPEHPASYTRSGLEIFFRPHDEDYANDEALHPKTAAFFRSSEFETEAERRRDAHQWETCLHGTKSKRASSLQNPCFDIHYNARIAGQDPSRAERIPYALLITIEARRHNDLYEQIRDRYRNVLRPIEPAIQIPIRS